MKISQLLTPALIKLDLESCCKDELFDEMVQLFADNGLVKDFDGAVRVLQERELKMSTGVGNGMAIPHGRLPEATNSLLAVGISREGIDYDALDGEPVYIVLTIFAQMDNPMQHMEVLAEISRLFAVPGFSERLRKASSSEEVLEIIKSEE
ncbi:MAG: PTS sugar transporter subunit IIA [Victivallales bacterium]|nr:PTS sugar transporter subunit IIA [Victivallales bacterium]